MRRKQAHPLRYVAPRRDTPRYSPVNMSGLPTWIPYLSSGTGSHYIPAPRVRHATQRMRDDDSSKCSNALLALLLHVHNVDQCDTFMHAAIRDLRMDFDQAYVDATHESATPESETRRVRRRIYIDLTVSDSDSESVIDLTRD